MRNYILILFLAILVISCRSKKAVDQSDPATNTGLPKDANRPIDADYTFFEKVILPPKFEQIKIGSKITMETEKNYLPTLDATTYIEKDQKVWMNLSLAFIGAARGLATPEGVKAYNKLDKTYIDTDFSYLNGLLNTNFIDYKALEKLLMGRTFVKINDTDFKLAKNPQGYRMTSIVNQKTVGEDGKSREYKVNLSYSNNYDLLQVLLEDVNSSDKLDVVYSGWQDFMNYRMPKNVKIIIKGSKPAQISIENTKFEDSKMQTPFSIPGNYKKIEI